MIRLHLPVALVALATLLAPVLAQQPTPVAIHIVGASVSAGFEDGPLFGAKTQGDSVPLQTLVRPWADDAGKVSMHAPLDMCAMFKDPLEVGAREMAMLRKRKPDIVLAIDFPFWFAYGYVGADQAKERSERLAQGLQMLADIDRPVLVGDLPDMRGAATRMLNPRQIPDEKLLAQLNEQLREFVAKHDKLHLVPLSGFVADMKVHGLALPLADGALQTAPGAMLQEDRLHATRLGVAYLAHFLQPHLVAVMPEGHALKTRQWTFEQFVGAAGADDELAALRERSLAPAGGKSGESGK